MKMMQAVSLLSAMALFGTVMADELQICAPKKRGSVRIAPKCNKNETALVVPVAAKGAPTPTGTTVVDANGQKLGLLLSGDDDAITIYDTSTRLKVGLRPDPVDPTILRTNTWNTRSYTYASADCSGEPLRIFHVEGDGSITPNNLNFWGDRQIFNIVYAEATTNETTQKEDLSGRYLTLGGQVAKQVNPTDASVVASSSLVHSLKGDIYYNDIYNDDVYGWARKPTGCTPLTVASEPVRPTASTYNGVTYPDSSSAQMAYKLDLEKYRLYSMFNEVGPKHTRWVFTYANTSAPFPSPVKLPLSFQ
ncbi:MAG: hypothetical protein ACK443_12325 [Methylococcaceae bacterium]|jgi:hypothetical protein